MPSAPSVTFWNRVEARPRSPSIVQGLSAAIRDPVWLLTRQWQLGEFAGEDAGSPALVELRASRSPMTGWGPEDGSMEPLTAAPLEALALGEPFSPDLSTRVELGQIFESLLAAAGTPGIIPAFRAAYPTAARPPDEQDAPPDQSAVLFALVTGGRVVDGFALYQAAQQSLPSLPTTPAIPSSVQPQVLDALNTFNDWVGEVFGTLGAADPPAWVPERLEHRLRVLAATPSGEAALLAAIPDADGTFDWHAFDLLPPATVEVPGPLPAAEVVTCSVIPAHVRFRGMPNARWWDFEDNTADYGGIAPDLRDVAKLVDTDFLLVHSNDWFVLPFTQPTGTLTRIDELIVHDVFGGLTLVERADLHPGEPGNRWSMFSTTMTADATRLADFFVLAPSTAASTQKGPILEEVLFLRDEMANLAWAVERTTESQIGEPWLGHERSLAASAPSTIDSTISDHDQPVGPPLQYQLQTTVPRNWFPLLPVRVSPDGDAIGLELGAMLRPDLKEIRPHGRILRPRLTSHSQYRIREEEVSRSGVRVLRPVFFSRWLDGTRHLWLGRERRAGLGEGSSGLRFDLAIPTLTTPEPPRSDST
jgi:hypothetical protein